MTNAPLTLAGEHLLLDPAGAAFWPERRVLLLADLHFEKGTAFASRGQPVPPWDTRTTLDLLAVLVRRWRPMRVIALGDSFHDDAGPSRLAAADRMRLLALAAAVPFVWVRGNHDPAPPDGLPGQSCEAWEEGALVFRHEAVGPPGAAGEVSGHFHPKASVAVRGTMVTRPCFVTDGRRLLLPALGAYAGGLDLRSPPILGLFPRGGRAFLLGRERLFSFAFPAGGGSGRRQR